MYIHVCKHTCTCTNMCSEPLTLLHVLTVYVMVDYIHVMRV